MAYRQVYFRIHTKGYSSGWSSDADRSAFKEESRRLYDKERKKPPVPSQQDMLL